ncbi:hypothetical protein P7228_03395 [Altererythrobacter arenosus]|uniref:NIPSNAP domain-containing protein n=1 Tax=Altererythrobacter arenosus TaxID=3032592 RepID=A0ABY8FTN1_9SPHN|nr:hypothetical protein [Altererythrobacter sp. CAU 1644]WFL78127.1 hypothetical protein P7228_03395 [Altererythrobacter sp. CAU 1644]
MKSYLKQIGIACVAASALSMATPAAAQLNVWEDYTPQKEIIELTYVKVDEGQLDTYLEGLKETWVKGNEIGKQLGQVTSYGIYAVPYGSNEVNLVLRITYPDMASQDASKAEYDKFMAAWGKENSDKANKTVIELYNKIRKIKGTYLLRELKMNP